MPARSTAGCACLLPVLQATLCAGGGRFQLKMNDFTWDEALLNGADFFAPGNLIAMEQGGRGGFEVRSNEGLT